jgi:putative DNA primase/helicase
MSQALEHAVRYAALGWRCFPIVEGTKKPTIKAWPEQATVDRTALTRWLANGKAYNLAVATGAGSGILVLDIDPRHGGDDSLSNLIDRYGPLPDTVECLTPSGGRHLYFRYPKETEIRNSVSKLAPGLDIRGEGGYALLPPSKIGGGSYEWEASSDPLEGYPVAQCPSWFIGLLVGCKPAKAHINGERIAEGGRNDALASFAGTMRRRGMSQAAIEAALLAENSEQCDPPLPDEEVRRIAASVAKYEPDPAVEVASKVETYARFLTTDLSNADRIIRFFGQDLMFSGGRWHFWIGTHWSIDEAEARKSCFNLSEIILGEAKFWQVKADNAGSEEEREKCLDIKGSLTAWAKKSEMLPRIEAAFKIVKDRVVVKQERINADPWLLNVKNGTIELRTGEIRPHRREDYINKIININYDAEARACRFCQFIAEIMGEVGGQHAPMSDFLQRWFGYCATGSIKEHKFCVHHGDGGNGKSTLLDIVSAVLGDYVSAAAPYLLVSGAADRHPTEIADLWGKRMITAHESGESGVLREEFIKQATGGDRLKGRFMRQDFFEFLPTHKIQLCTNYKPTMKGTDFGIWRRVLLIPYTIIFGTAEEVANGDAHEIKDPTLPDQLLQEQEGILGWIIQGAAIWYREGLNPPDAVIMAGAAYREEQDRIGQFVREECVTGSDYWEPLNFPRIDDYGVKKAVGLYPAYVEWCKASGYHQLGKGRFQEALEKKARGRWVKKYLLGAAGKRREVLVFEGIHLIDGLRFSEAAD